VPLKRIAVSCGLEPSTAPGALASELWDRFRQLRAVGARPLWQLDGRPMSGDVGDGTARAAVQLLRRLAPGLPPGPLQLAGGTNGRTLSLVQELDGGLPWQVAGVAFGSVARVRLQDLLGQAHGCGGRLLDQPDLLRGAIDLAAGLVTPWLRRSR
jgi:hypothetical protein